MLVSLNLVPLLVMSSIWLLFMFSKNLVSVLISLLFMSVMLPMIWMDTMKVFWPCGLVLILMTTGLIVVFGYIVSLYEEGSNLENYISLMLILLVGIAGTLYFYNLSYGFHSLMTWIYVHLHLSTFVIFMLLFLVISFVLLTYSKGGGFRKKF